MLAWQTGADPDQSWDEAHDLPSTGPTANGDILHRDLEAGVAFHAYLPNVSTPWVCGIHDALDASNTYAVKVSDIDGNLADCAWGLDPDAPANAIADVLAGIYLEQNISAQDRAGLSASCGVFSFQR